MYRTIALAKTGISFLRNFEAIAEFLEGRADIHQFGGDDAEAKLTHAKEIAAQAEREIGSGFHLMNAQSVVTLWSLLYIREFCEIIFSELDGKRTRCLAS
jgi:hypothetical protein